MDHDPSAHNESPDAAGDPRSQKARMQSGDLYIADDPELQAEARQAYQLARDYADQYASDQDAARQTLERLLGRVAQDAHIKPPIYVDYGKYITVGARTFINYGLVALDVAPITIGDDVQIGPNVQLLTPTHPIAPEPRRQKYEAAEPIVIGNNVWLGGGVIVLPGVTIGENSVIGAGAVVTRDIPPNAIAVGNPARVVRRIDAAAAQQAQGEPATQQASPTPLSARGQQEGSAN